MSEAAPALNAPQTTETLPSTQPPAGEPANKRGLFTSGLRIEDDAPVDTIYRGKSAAELVQIAETYRQAATSGWQQPQYQQPSHQQNYQPPQQAAFSYQAQNTPQPPDPNTMYSDPVGYQQRLLEYNQSVMQQTLQSTLQSAAAPLLSGVAESAKWQSQSDAKLRDVWGRYGHEIETLAARHGVQPTSKSQWDTLAKIVKGEHADEFIDERARQMAANGGSGLESAAPSGAVSVPASDPIAALFAEPDHPWVKNAMANGTSANDVRRYCQAMHIDPQQYVDDIRKQNAFGARSA